MTKQERPAGWRGVPETGWAKLNESSASGRQDIDRAIAEAARRDRVRRSQERNDGCAAPSGDPSFHCIDSFDLPSVPSGLHGSGTRVRVVLVESVRDTPERTSTAELIAEFGLTPRETDVALGLADRLSSAEIAAALGISVNTARRHSERVLEKLGLRSRREINSVLRRRHKGG